MWLFAEMEAAFYTALTTAIATIGGAAVKIYTLFIKNKELTKERDDLREQIAELKKERSADRKAGNKQNKEFKELMAAMSRGMATLEHNYELECQHRIKETARANEAEEKLKEGGKGGT